MHRVADFSYDSFQARLLERGKTSGRADDNIEPEQMITSSLVAENEPGFPNQMVVFNSYVLFDICIYIYSCVVYISQVLRNRGFHLLN